MRNEGAIVDQPGTRRKPWALTDREVCVLMQALTRDKTMVTEADCLTLCRWAQAPSSRGGPIAGTCPWRSASPRFRSGATSS